MIAVLYFMTTGWTCPVCVGMKPHVIQVCKDMNVKLQMVDISKPGPENEDLAMPYNICGLPTVVVLRDGMEVGRIDSGVTKQGIISLIKAAREE